MQYYHDLDLKNDILLLAVFQNSRSESMNSSELDSAATCMRNEMNGIQNKNFIIGTYRIKGTLMQI